MSFPAPKPDYSTRITEAAARAGETAEVFADRMLDRMESSRWTVRWLALTAAVLFLIGVYVGARWL